MKTKPQKHLPPEYMLSIAIRLWAKEKAPLVDLEALLDDMRDWDFHRAHVDWDRVFRTHARKEQKKAEEKIRRDNFYRGVHTPIVNNYDIEMQKLKKLRQAWSIPFFRDPNPGESVSDYRRAMSEASDEVRAGKNAALRFENPLRAMK